jgi:hypothetical protein
MLSEDAPRDALNAIIAAHPAGNTFIKPLLRYIGMFSPEKSQLSHRRMAALINELAPSIQSAQIERNGRVLACPIGYWQAGLELVLANRDAGLVRTPLKSHGYLFEVLIGMSSRDEAKAEQRIEDKRAGHSGVGVTPDRAASVVTGSGPVRLDASLPKQAMPEHVRNAIANLKKSSN